MQGDRSMFEMFDNHNRIMPSELNRRRHPRYPVKARVLVMPEGDGARGDAFWGSTRDLSTGGLFIRANKQLPVGSWLTAKIVLGDGPLLRTSARVAHEADAGFGCAFVSLDEVARADLQRALLSGRPAVRHRASALGPSNAF